MKKLLNQILLGGGERPSLLHGEGQHFGQAIENKRTRKEESWDMGSVKNAVVGLGLTLSMVAGASDQLIVKFKDGYRPDKNFIRNSKLNLFSYLKDDQKAQIQTYKIPTAFSRSGLDKSLNELRNHPGVEYVQEDHVLEFRGNVTNERQLTPSDPEFNTLWGLQNQTESNKFGTNAVAAWEEFGTGGEDALGKEIVVVVIDGGFDINHEDLSENVFVNPGEIPGNGIDDDGNGYVDDVSGWNFITNTPNLSPSSHGTHVMGTVGAVGDNGTGVTGVNWNVKIIPLQISMRGLRTSQVLAAYEYALNMKKLFDKTNGRKGANVVVTNSSFGKDRANCNSFEFAAWNDIYDRMGEQGILSAVATANRSYDIDTVGDVPSACSSDYVISVTNVASFGSILGAWGKENVDIAAPGTNILSTVLFDSYDQKMGTSMATPHVAGTVAYLHSAASSDFANYFDSTPGSAALMLKDALLETSTRVDSFEASGKPILTSGTLDILASARLLSEL